MRLADVARVANTTPRLQSTFEKLMPTQRILDVVMAEQQATMKALRDQVLASARPTINFTDVVRDAFQHVNLAAAIEPRVSVDFLESLAAIVESGEVEEELLDDGQFEADLLAAIDVAAERLAEANPVMNRATARAVVVLTVKLLWIASLVGLSVANPFAAAVGVGLSALTDTERVSDVVAEGFDRVVRPRERE